MAALRRLAPDTIRRLAVSRQRLAETPAKVDRVAMLDVARDLGCLQLDPTSAVARSHLLVLWSRLGAYAQADLEHLLWMERALFEYWAHAASIVLAEDFGLHRHMMVNYLKEESGWSKRVRDWVTTNHALKSHILDTIRERGPVSSAVFEDKVVSDWYSSGWTSKQNVSQMLMHLWTTGVITVAQRKSGHRLWDLMEKVFPEHLQAPLMDEREVVRRSTEKALRALGAATPTQIKQHFTRARYPGLPEVLRVLERDGRIQRVKVMEDGREWPGEWFVHSADMALVERLEAGEWGGRTTLLSPFDNLICDRKRTEQVFRFNFRIEIYVPKNKRQYGYFVLPILHGDHLIGRVDPLMNRKRSTLMVNAVYAEPDAPMDRKTGTAIGEALTGLAAFLGAEKIEVQGSVPKGWDGALRRL
jgi:hypothetical protein